MPVRAWFSHCFRHSQCRKTGLNTTYLFLRRRIRTFTRISLGRPTLIVRRKSKKSVLVCMIPNSFYVKHLLDSFALPSQFTLSANLLQIIWCLLWRYTPDKSLQRIVLMHGTKVETFLNSPILFA